jgi:uncharacterized YigZ family protein
VKGSRFIGYAAPAPTVEEAEAFIGEIIRTHHDATHHCPAFRVGRGDAIRERSRDDGEPSGTAGKPILEAIRARDLEDVVCVVVRYFGGTKLGTGGLIRAYRQCAGETLDSGNRVERIQTIPMAIRFPSRQTGTVMRLLDSVKARIEKTEYDTETIIRVRIRPSLVDGFCLDLTERTGGDARIVGEEVRDR